MIRTYSEWATAKFLYTKEVHSEKDFIRLKSDLWYREKYIAKNIHFPEPKHDILKNTALYHKPLSSPGFSCKENFDFWVRRCINTRQHMEYQKKMLESMQLDARCSDSRKFVQKFEVDLLEKQYEFMKANRWCGAFYLGTLEVDLVLDPLDLGPPAIPETKMPVTRVLNVREDFVKYEIALSEDLTPKPEVMAYVDPDTPVRALTPPVPHQLSVATQVKRYGR